MNCFMIAAKVFALLLLIFVNSNSTLGQGDSVYRLPAGTRMMLRMDAEINSKVSSVNDTFITTIVKPVYVRDVMVLPKGTIVEGRVTRVSPAGIGGRSGVMEIRMETIRFGDTAERDIEALPIAQPKAPSTRYFGILTVVGGTAAGALVGAASRSSTGILIGAGIGAGAGTGVAALRKGKDVYLKEDEQFEIELKKGVTLPVLDY